MRNSSEWLSEQYREVKGEEDSDFVIAPEPLEYALEMQYAE